jgi:multicomponent Na+:H+ antiporter subunit D
MHGINPTLLIIVFFLFLAGIGKAAIMPFHAWLPAAMVAPTPVSALLHALAVVNTGVFCVLRVIFHIFGIKLMQELNLGVVTAFLASFTILTASIYALTRDNLKVRLAYSTVSQLSYIILGGALLTPSGMTGGIMHIVIHAFSKITLFFCAGSIYVATHKKNISEMSGIGRQMPWTMTAFAIGALSMIGVPPLSGFITKWYLGLGSIEAHQPLILIVLLASSLLNAAYFVPIIYKAFFDVPEGLLRLKPMSLGAAARGFDEEENHKEEHTVKEPSNFILIPLMLTAVISLMLGLFPDFLLTFVKEVLK